MKKTILMLTLVGGCFTDTDNDDGVIGGTDPACFEDCSETEATGDDGGPDDGADDGDGGTDDGGDDGTDDGGDDGGDDGTDDEGDDGTDDETGSTDNGSGEMYCEENYDCLNYEVCSMATAQCVIADGAAYDVWILSLLLGKGEMYNDDGPFPLELFVVVKVDDVEVHRGPAIYLSGDNLTGYSFGIDTLPVASTLRFEIWDLDEGEMFGGELAGDQIDDLILEKDIFVTIPLLVDGSFNEMWVPDPADENDIQRLGLGFVAQ